MFPHLGLRSFPIHIPREVLVPAASPWLPTYFPKELPITNCSCLSNLSYNVWLCFEIFT